MRYSLSIVFFILVFVSSYGQTPEIGTSYIFSVPRGTMADNIKYANGLNLDFYFTPKEKRYSFGFEMSVSTYGHDKTRQTYTLSDGSSAPMDIIVNNNFYNIMFAGRYFLTGGKIIQPFITGKLGYSFFNTELSINDPDDFDHCEPVDTDVLSKDGTIIFSAGAGLRWDVLSKRNPGFFYINMSANYLAGGKVDYMNVDAPNHNHVAHTSDVYAKFLETQTQIVHEHHVGNVYSSPIELLDFRLGVSVMLGRR